MACSVILAAACSGSGSGPTTPVAQGARPTAVVGHGAIESVAAGYSAALPAGWEAQPSFLVTQSAVLDVLLPAGKPDPETSISIECAARSPTGGDWAASEADRIDRIASGPVERGAVAVAGVAAVELVYEAPSAAQGATLRRTTVLFSAGACDWTLQLSEPAGADLSAIFGEFLGSFRLR